MTEQMSHTPAARPEGAEPTRPRRVWRPLADIVEVGDAILLMVEMPGVPAGDVEVTLEQRVLTIRGRTAFVAPENLRLLHAEYAPGDYERIFTLSGDFDGERIEAEAKNGVLTLRLPREAEAEARRIKVRAA